MLKIGIVGLPNAGKSTLFNALVEKGRALTGKHPFTTIDKNMGMVPVSDSTLVNLAKIANISKVTQTTVTFVDIAGLVKGAHQGEGLGNQFLAYIREVNLILHVVRFFTDETVPHIHPKIDPDEDVEIINTELLLADIELLKKQLDKLEKKTKTEEEKKLLILGERVLKELDSGKQAKELFFNEDERKLIKLFNLLTLKPVIYVANVNESDLKKPAKLINNSPTITLSAKFEEELISFPWIEQIQILKTYGLTQSAVELVISQCYQLLEVITFYTIAGGKEARAWTVKKGTTVWEAAGKIHTNFARRFIKAAVISADDLLEIGSWTKAQEMGKVALVGRDYFVQDKDVVMIKTNA